MSARIYKKMAGTAAVFVVADTHDGSPVERDGMTWSDEELGMTTGARRLHWKEPMDSSLALEGLEEYDPPAPGDARYVNKLGVAFVYIGKIRGWVELTAFA